MSMAIESKIVILQMNIDEIGKRVNAMIARLEAIEQRLNQLDAVMRPTREVLHAQRKPA